MSSAELSIDISRLVSRARSGEAIDTNSEGEVLAARYPDLGMSPELIGKAISRAAAMMGLALDGPPGATANELPGADGEPSPPLRPIDGATAPFRDGASIAVGTLVEAAEADCAPRHPQGTSDDEPRTEGNGDTRSLAAPVSAMRRAFFGL